MNLNKLLLIALTFLIVFTTVNAVTAANSTANRTNEYTAQHIVVWEDGRDSHVHLYYKNQETGASSRVS